MRKMTGRTATHVFRRLFAVGSRSVQTGDFRVAAISEDVRQVDEKRSRRIKLFLERSSWWLQACLSDRFHNWIWIKPQNSKIKNVCIFYHGSGQPLVTDLCYFAILFRFSWWFGHLYVLIMMKKIAETKREEPLFNTQCTMEVIFYSAALGPYQIPVRYFIF